jgi:hypothetical protein
MSELNLYLLVLCPKIGLSLADHASLCEIIACPPKGQPPVFGTDRYDQAGSY